MTIPEQIMKKQQFQSATEVRIIEAGEQAQELHEQLAAIRMASAQIIETMRAMRKNIPLPNRTDGIERISLQDIDE